MKDPTTSASGMHDGSGRRGALEIFGWAALIVLVAAQATFFTISPPEVDMGHLQKILYVHVPAAWSAFLAFFVVFLAGLVYLWRRDERWDRLGAAAAEVGAVLLALNLVLGSIWGRPTWGVWWTWDPRITTTAVLLLIFIGYFTLRAFIDEPDRRARWSAVVGIFGALNVPVVYMSVRWWRSLHQLQSSPETMASVYAWGLRINAIAFLLAMIYFVMRRYRTAGIEREAERLEDEAALSPGGANG